MAFIIPFPKGKVFWIAYIAEMIAIVLQIPVFQAAFNGQETLRSKVLGFPVFRVGYIYLSIQTILSFALFSFGFIEKFPVWLAAFICVIVLVGALICTLTTDIARDVVQNSEIEQEAAISRMIKMRSLTAGFPSLTEDPKLKKALSGLAEDFRFSDPVSSTATDDVESELEMKLFALSEKLTTGKAISDDVKALQNLLAQRNEMCKAGK